MSVPAEKVIRLRKLVRDGRTAMLLFDGHTMGTLRDAEMILNEILADAYSDSL